MERWTLLSGISLHPQLHFLTHGHSIVMNNVLEVVSIRSFSVLIYFFSWFCCVQRLYFSVAHTAFSPTYSLNQCSAYSASPSSEKTWTIRSTFPEYVVALATIVGSVLFAVSSIFIKFNFCFNIRAKYLA